MLLTWGASRGGAGLPSFALGFADLGLGAVDTSSQGIAVTPTYTGATTKTTIGPTGLVVSVASGTARSYYDPTSLAYLGYLAEGSRTNLLLQSADMTNASWVKTDTTPTLSGTGPDGVTNSANLLTEGVAGNAGVTQSVTATADAAYTVSYWVKRGNTDWFFSRISATGASADAWFNLGTGAVGATAVGGTGSAVSSTITSYPNSWFRVTHTATMGGGQTAIAVLHLNTNGNSSTTRVNNATRSMWGAQFESGASFASSHMPTTVASFTRNADVLSYPVTWLNAAAGTLFSAFTQTGVNGATLNGNLFTLSAATFGIGDGYLLRLASSTSIDSGGNGSASSIVGTYTVGTACKAASAYQVSGTTMITVANGAVGAQVATLDFTGVGTTKANIGSLQGDNTQHFFGAISRIAYFPNRLDNSALVAMTA